MQPKVFERELWYIYDNIDENEWISRGELKEIKQKILDLKKMKKELNPLLSRQRKLKELLDQLKMKVDQEEGSEADAEATVLANELTAVTKDVTPRVAALEAIEDEIFDRVVFFPNCRPSDGAGDDDQVILSVSYAPSSSTCIKST